jgi:hypothetical protein
MGLKAPRGFGWLTNPKKAAYNRIYNRTSRGCLVSLNRPTPPELNDPALRKEYLDWRHERYLKKLAALKPLDN